MPLMCDQKYIYVIFSRTHTGIGAFIRFITHTEYNHVSIALEEDLKTMYAFTRYHKNAPFVAGFSEESALRYCSCEKEITNVKICKIPICIEKYNAISEYLKTLQINTDQYLYNLFSAALYPTGIKLHIPKSYTCLEFAVHILSTFYIADGIYDHRFYKIIELECILDRYMVYEGDITGVAHPDGWGNDVYPLNVQRTVRVISSAKRVGRLLSRAMGY